MMMIDDFILETSPWKREDDNLKEIVNILDNISMDPIERELIKTKFVKEMKCGGTVLPYRGDLLKEYIEFYKSNQKALAIEIIGLNNIVLTDYIGKMFVRVLDSESFVSRMYTEYTKSTQGMFVIAILGISQDFVVESKENARDIMDTRVKELHKKGSTLILEVIGSETKEDGEYYLLVIYDRHYNKHGYVALKININ
jgi:hypothetical protein